MQVQHGDLLISSSSTSRYTSETFARPGDTCGGTVRSVTTSSTPALHRRHAGGAHGSRQHRSGLPMTPILFVLGSCISLQVGAALATQLFDQLGPFGTTTLRLAIAAIVLLVIVRPKVHRFTREQWIAVILFGIVVGAMNGNFYAAIDRIPLGTAVALEFLGPLTVAAVLSTRRSDLLWVALALAGVSLFGLESLTGASDLDILGVVFALIAAVFWGLYVLTSARVGRLVPGPGRPRGRHGGRCPDWCFPFGAPGALVGLMDLRLLGTRRGHRDRGVGAPVLARAGGSAPPAPPRVRHPAEPRAGPRAPRRDAAHGSGRLRPARAGRPCWWSAPAPE